VTAACIGASGLTDAKPAGKLVDFDDRLGVGAIVIQGEYPQKHMKNAQGRVLCLFHKKTRTPYISEAPTYFASRPETDSRLGSAVRRQADVDSLHGTG
jgi:hypothetical protein